MAHSNNTFELMTIQPVNKALAQAADINYSTDTTDLQECELDAKDLVE